MITPDARPDIATAWKLVARADSLRPKSADARIAQVLAGGVIGKVARGSGLTATGPLADSARRVLDRAVQVDRKDDPKQELMGYEAIMLTQMGDLDEAMVRLKRYVALNPDHSFQVEGQVHWWWRDLRNRPDFQSLLVRR
jgi:hypothetical protein